MFKIQKVHNRSIEENKYYWGVVVNDIVEFSKLKRKISMNSEVVHTWVKFTFGIESTATLNTTEFETLMANIRNHCKYYWDLVIPEPESSE